MIDFIPPGDHRGREINELQLHGELESAGVRLHGVGLIKDEDGETVMVRVHLPGEPDAVTQQRISQALAAHTPAESPRLAKERLDAGGVAYLDLRTFLADDEYHDHCHTNLAGSRRMTERLARFLRDGE